MFEFMGFFHKNLKLEDWRQMPKVKQILNICSELARARNMMRQGEVQYFRDSLDRAYELIDFTSVDDKWRGSALKELRRLREMLGEFYLGLNSSIKEFDFLLKAMLSFDAQSEQVEIS